MCVPCAMADGCSADGLEARCSLREDTARQKVPSRARGVRKASGLELMQSDLFLNKKWNRPKWSILVLLFLPNYNKNQFVEGGSNF